MEIELAIAPPPRKRFGLLWAKRLSWFLLAICILAIVCLTYFSFSESSKCTPIRAYILVPPGASTGESVRLEPIDAYICDAPL